MRQPTNQRLAPAALLREIRGRSLFEITLLLVTGFCGLQLALLLAITLLHATHRL